MDTLTLPPVSRFSGSVQPPGSKSIANRVLPLAAVARGRTRLRNLPDGEDVALMRAALAQLGFAMAAGSEIEIAGTGHGFQSAPGRAVALHLGNSGTCTRILTALLAAGEGVFRIDGVPRLRERPIGDLVEALRPLAAPATHIHYEGMSGFPPLRIEAQGLAGGRTRIRGNLSSQFTTGLLLALPLCRGDAEVEVEGKLVSAPYVDLTVNIMAEFSAAPECDGHCRFRSRARGYMSPGTFTVEPDASSASYFMAGAAIAGGPVTIRGLKKDSPQGEARFAEVLERMGAQISFDAEGITVRSGAEGLHGIDADMDSMSDTGMTLAVTALFAKGATTIRNVGNWRLKETDRLRAMAAELRKVGAAAEEGEDYLIIHPPETLRPAEIETYDDHRMAMCFALASLGGVAITLRDPGCVRKTYPGFFGDFHRLAA